MKPGGSQKHHRSLDPHTRTVRLKIAYDGTAFYGWQRQPGLRTVQACLEEAVAKVTGAPVKLLGSGRTDAGVHALGQVGHFSTSCPIPAANLVKALNDILPADVRVLQAEDAPPGFHARYDARSKVYLYRVLQAAICSPFRWRYVWHYPYPLDRRKMAEAAQAFLGEHDFTSFAASDRAEYEADGVGTDSTAKPRSMVRRLSSSKILWSARRQTLAYEVEGNGFLHHMVRNIVGTLVEVGRGAMSPNEMDIILRARDRARAGPTAPAQGLCLVQVTY